MSVKLQSITYYLCICDKCKKAEKVEPSKKIYNGAQAVRSINWSFGKNKTVLCQKCRRTNLFDNYIYH